MSTPAYLSRRALLRASIAVAGGAIVTACGSSAPTNPSPTIPAPTNPASPPPVPTMAATLAAVSPAAAPTAPLPATTGTTGITGTTPAGAPTVMMSGKTLPELRIAVPSLPATLDPQETWGIAWYRVFSMTYDTLLRIDYQNNSKLSPGLASAWQRTDDRTLEVTLRRDVHWQDGTPFTATDVKYTFDRVMSGDPKLNAAKPTYFPLSSVTILDDYRVRFVTPAVDALLETRLAAPGSQIVPAAYHRQVGVDAFRTKPLGSGPYQLVEFAKDDHLTFTAHHTYFGGAPAAERVTVRAIPEVATRVAAAINGEIDIATDIPPDQVAGLQSHANLTLKDVTLVNAHMLMFNGLRKPLDNKLIRQALNLAIDRKALTEQLWGGQAVWTRGLQFAGDSLYNPNRPLTPYDPDKAKALLQQSGYAGEEIRYLHNSPNYYTLEGEAAEAIQGMWRQIGVKTKDDGIEFAQWSAEFARADSPYHALSTSQSSEIGDPNTYLYQGYGPMTTLQRAKSAPGIWDQYNDLGRQALSTLDMKQRFALYQQMLDIWDDLAQVATLYIPKGIYTVANTINWNPQPLYYLDLRPSNFSLK